MKRFLDVVIALFSILLLSPIYVILAVLIKIESRGPVFFVQKRVGKNEKPFKMFKFRTMLVNAIDPEELGRIKHNHSVVTKVGHFLRRTKLDEIPQFFNVLLGEMSIVGPRPCLFFSIKTMSLLDRRRFKVVPGLMGWAEINGNVELSWKEQLWLDLWYVDHQSFWLDLHIMGKSLLTILFGSIKNNKALQKAQQYNENLAGSKIK